jgi:hypothetical protein
MGRVVERQDQQTSLLTQIKDLTIDNRSILDAVKKALWIISTAAQQSRGYLNSCALRLQTIASKNYLATAVGYLKSIAATIGKLTGTATATATTTPTVTGEGSGSGVSHFASGGIAWAPQLAHIAERGPEIIMPLRDYRAEAVQATGRSGPVVVNIRPVVIDKKDRYLIEFIQEGFDHNVFRIPTASVGG